MKRGCSWAFLVVGVLFKRENLVTYFSFIKKCVLPSDIEGEKSILKAKMRPRCSGKTSPFSRKWRSKAHEEGELKAKVFDQQVLPHGKCNGAFKELGSEGEIERKGGYLFIYETEG